MTHTSAENNVIDIGGGTIEGDRPPLVKSGEYDLSFKFYETVKLFGGKVPKLALWFEIVTLGPSHGQIVPRYYNVTSIKGKPRRSGDFGVGWNSDFVREYAELFGLPPQRSDRIPMTRFKECLIKGQIREVKTGYRQRSIPKSLRYSVVGQLLAVKQP